MKSPQTQTKKKKASNGKEPPRRNCCNLITSDLPTQLPMDFLSSSVVTASHHLDSALETAPACLEICMEAKDQNALSSKER